MINMEKFKKLDDWLMAHAFTINVNELTKQFPCKETHGLTKHIRNKCETITNKIIICAKIYAINYKKDLLKAAAYEIIQVGSLLMFAHDLKYISDEKYERCCKLIEILMDRIGELIAKCSNEKVG